MRVLEPYVGCWYKDVIQKSEFEVVSFDEDNDSIAIQYIDGNIEELELENWYQMHIRYIAAPEVWSGGLYSSEDNAFEQEIIIKPDNWDVLADIEDEDSEDHY